MRTISYLTEKFKEYRIKCPIDQNTNDYPKKLNGTNEDIDLYIDCSGGKKIFYSGLGILEAYVPSIKTGRNIIRQIYYENINSDNVEISTSEFIRDGKTIIRTTYKIKDESVFNKDIENSKFISDILETDSEVTFRFPYKNSEKIIPLLDPKTSGASISPFSSRNLPKEKYIIPTENIEVYKSITDKIPKEDKLIISRITSSFINSVMAKSKPYKKVDMKSLMRKKMLKGKEFIHSEGYWNQYIDYLETQLEEQQNDFKCERL